MKTLDIVLIILGVFIFSFVVCMIVIFCKYQTTPDTLITCVLGAGGVEAVITGLITIEKVKKGKDKDFDNDELL